MKKIVILFLAMLGFTFAHAQKISVKEVPEIVRNILQKNYPGAKGIRWTKENADYEADFEVKDADYSLLIDVSGNILETEIGIKIDELPENVKAYIAKEYSGQKIKEAAKIIDNKGVLTYEAEIKGRDLIFSSKGNLIKK